MFSSPLVIWCLSLLINLGCFFSFVCLLVNFWFVVFFWYSGLYIYVWFKFPISSFKMNFYICYSSWLLVLISYLCMSDFVPLLYVSLYCWSSPFIIFLILVVSSSAQRSPFRFCCNISLLALNSLIFHLTIKLSISLLNLNASLAGYSWMF